MLDYDRCEISLSKRGLFFSSYVVKVDLIASQVQLRIIQHHSLLMHVVFYTAESARVHAFELLERRNGPWSQEYPDHEFARITERNAREGVAQFREMLDQWGETGDRDDQPPFDPDEMADRVARGIKPSHEDEEDEC